MFIVKHEFSQENYNTFSYFPSLLIDWSWDSEKHKFPRKMSGRTYSIETLFWAEQDWQGKSATEIIT